MNMDGVNLDKIHQQFIRYQVEQNLGVHDQRIDSVWGDLMSKYPDLAEVMLALLTVFHGNADSERIFSAVRHVDTDFRKNMSLALLDALMVVKRHLIVNKKACFSYSFTAEFLRRAKGATTKANTVTQRDGNVNDELHGVDVSGQVMRLLQVDQVDVVTHPSES